MRALVRCRVGEAQYVRPGGDNAGPRCQILPMTGRGRAIAAGARLSNLANILTNVVGRRVVDKTGLTGPFNINLTWTPVVGMQPQPPGVPAVAPVQPDGPSIFTALEEQPPTPD